MKTFNTANFLNQGNTENDIILLNKDEITLQIIAATEKALRSIRIYSADLEADIYNHETFKNSILNFFRDNRHANIQILATDTQSALHSGHILIHLAQQLPSKIQIRIAAEEYQLEGISFMLIDQPGFLYRAEKSIYSSCKFRSEKLQEFFISAWEHAVQDPHSRQFII